MLLIQRKTPNKQIFPVNVLVLLKYNSNYLVYIEIAGRSRILSFGKDFTIYSTVLGFNKPLIPFGWFVMWCFLMLLLGSMPTKKLVKPGIELATSSF